MHQASLGVDAAHANHVIHRDIKPGNILVTPRTRRAIVIDFGLGQRVRSTTGIPLCAAAGSSPSAPSGTPEYMAPELAHDPEASVLTDVYRLGATLFSCSLWSRQPIPSKRI